MISEWYIPTNSLGIWYSSLNSLYILLDVTCVGKTKIILSIKFFSKKNCENNKAANVLPSPHGASNISCLQGSFNTPYCISVNVLFLYVSLIIEHMLSEERNLFFISFKFIFLFLSS